MLSSSQTRADARDLIDHDHAGQKRNRRIAVAAAVAVFQRVMQVASTFVLMPMLLQVLGPAGFGIWGAAASLAWLSGLVDIGTGSALVTLVARSSAEGVAEARRHVAGALTFGCALSGLILLLSLLAMISGLPQFQTGPYFITLIGLAVNIPLNAANNVWMALQKGYISALWEFVQTLLTTAGLIFAASRTADVMVFVAVVYVSLVLANLGSLIHLFWRHPELRPAGLLAPLDDVREVAGQGMIYFALGLTGGLSFLLDNVLALSFLGPEASARMTIALRICVTAMGALGVMSQPLWPAFAEAAVSGHRPWILRVLLRGAALLSALAIAGSAILLIWGERVLRWWLHGSLNIDSSLLWAIAVWVLAQALIRIPGLLLNGLHIIRYQVLVFLVSTLLALLLKAVLSSRLGVAGILWGTTLSVLLVALPAVVWRIYRWATDSFAGRE